MLEYKKKWVTIWVLGFLTLIAFLNAFNSVLLWVQYGRNLSFEPYLIHQFIGNILVEQYFWISVTIGFVFLGCTAFVAYRRSVYNDLINTMGAQQSLLEKLFEEFRTNLKSHEHVEAHIDDAYLKNLQYLETQFGNIRGELSGTLSKQGAMTKSVGRLNTTIANVRGNLIDMKKELKSLEEVKGNLANIKGLDETIAKVRSDIANIKGLNGTFTKVRSDIADMRKGLQALEDELLSPEPRLIAESSPNEIKGIGPLITEELQAIGITSAGEFLIADPEVIGGKTHLSEKQVERLQGMVQLLMIPYIDETDVELLEKVGVTNRKELAVQDPFELSVKLSEATKVYNGDKKIEAEKPTLEEILYWVRVAKM